jgi:hypothetical protein
MRYLILFAGMVLVFCGCARTVPDVISQPSADTKPRQSPAELAKAIIASNEEIAGLLEGIKDEASFQAARPALEKAANHRRPLNDSFSALNLSEDGVRSLQESHPEVVSTRTRVRDAQFKALENAPGRASLINDLLERAGFPRAALFRKTPRS